MVDDIQEYSTFNFEDIIDKYDNELDRKIQEDALLKDDSEEESDESDSDSEKSVIQLGNTFKFLLNMFSLEVDFDGIVRNRKLTHCDYGNIRCNKCKQSIMQVDQPLKYIEQFGCIIMQYHLVGDAKSSLISTMATRSQFQKDESMKKEDIILCPQARNPLIISDFYTAISKDALNTKEQIAKNHKRETAFLMSVLNCYYGDQALYIQYLRKSARKFRPAMDLIRKEVDKRHKKEKLPMSRKKKDLMHLYYDMYYERKRKARDVISLKAETSNAILFNPKKKKTSLKSNSDKKRTKMMYYGYDLSVHNTVEERNEMREFIYDKQIKLNWHTVELVNKKTRKKENKLTKTSNKWKEDIHWLGTSNMNGKEETFIVSHTLIPKNYKNDPGHLFSKEFFEKIKANTPQKVDSEIIDQIQNEYNKLDDSSIQKVKLTIDEKTMEKSWEVLMYSNINYKNIINESWLIDNLDKEEWKDQLDAMLTIKDVWHQFPVGGKREIPQLPKIEENELIRIYLPNEMKCAFGNLANALYAIFDDEAANFFEQHMRDDYKTITSFLNNDGTKGVMNHFTIAVRLMQYRFGYTARVLKNTDNLFKPPKSNTIKFVTLLGSYDDHKHSIAIVGKKIYDSTNRKVLTLCRESIAWCSSKSVQALMNTGKTIQCGYTLIPPKKKKSKTAKRKLSENDEEIKIDNESDIVSKKQKVSK